MNLANLLYKRNMFSEAAEHYRKVIALNPKDTQAFNNLAVACFRLERYVEALEYLNKAESLGFQPHPDFKSALLQKIKK